METEIDICVNANMFAQWIIFVYIKNVSIQVPTKSMTAEKKIC